MVRKLIAVLCAACSVAVMTSSASALQWKVNGNIIGTKSQPVLFWGKVKYSDTNSTYSVSEQRAECEYTGHGEIWNESEKAQSEINNISLSNCARWEGKESEAQVIVTPYDYCGAEEKQNGFFVSMNPPPAIKEEHESFFNTGETNEQKLGNKARQVRFGGSQLDTALLPDSFNGFSTMRSWFVLPCTGVEEEWYATEIPTEWANGSVNGLSPSTLKGESKAAEVGGVTSVKNGVISFSEKVDGWNLELVKLV